MGARAIIEPKIRALRIADVKACVAKISADEKLRSLPVKTTNLKNA
jgi:hypothetical protein